jgi:outer membrane protein TolC
MHSHPFPAAVLVTSFATLFSVPSLAVAQQPLEEFLAASDVNGIDVHSAQAALDTARSQADEARARLLPSGSAIGTYQRNEYQVQIMLAPDRIATLQLYDQLAATLSITVPIVDVSGWTGFFAAEQSADAAEERYEGTLDDVHASVVLIWHQLVGLRAVRESARRTLEVATASRDSVQARFEAQVAPQLELSRAEAEVQRATQVVEEANLQVVLTERNLQNLTGLEPTQAEASLDDDLHAEASLDDFLRHSEEAPLVRAAAHSVRAAELGVDAAWEALLPTIGGTVREQITNASGFSPSSQWAVLLTASWSLDFLRPAQIGTRGGQLASARAQEELAEQQAETRIYEQWHRVQSLRAAAAAATAARDSLERAAQDAHLRFDAGAATQLDVIQADRDFFQAEVQRIQAIANLRVARYTLRIRAEMDGTDVD